MKPEQLFELFRARNLFRLMSAPAAWLAPVTALAASMTFGMKFGRWGALLGLVFGLGLGVVLVVLWYAVVLGKLFDRDEEEFAEKLIEEAREGRLRRKPAAAGEVEPLPLEAARPLAVSIDGALPDAIARIDAHGEADPKGALAAAEALRARHPREPAAAALLARSLSRAGRPREALIEAGEALHVGVLKGEVDAAAALLVELWDDRDELVLDRSVREALAAHFERAGDPDRAVALRARTSEDPERS